MVTIRLQCQEVERIIELLEREPDLQAHIIADGLRESVGWRPQADDPDYVAPVVSLHARTYMELR